LGHAEPDAARLPAHRAAGEAGGTGAADPGAAAACRDSGAGAARADSAAHQHGHRQRPRCGRLRSDLRSRRPRRRDRVIRSGPGSHVAGGTAAPVCRRRQLRIRPLPEITVQAAADLVGGRLLGDGAVVLRRASALDRAGADAVSLVVSSRYLPLLRESGAGAVLVPESLAGENGGPATRIVVAEPYRAL